ncbi:hypothetical protein JG687_00010384 [Phytophthora cactorum]|uniref:PiggyBac transposable element-derived protein domain-containing protein n=1 Tax=Phytophthora cactorum TaxID=29920 RepID=A0A8T1UCG1_9STRA|nr:hypothetical protein JG687_00010384 [Phytophthora cactorum]
MAMFTWLIDIAITNSHTLLKTVRPAAVSGVELREFKRRLADSLTKLKKRNKQRRELQQQKSVFVRLLMTLSNIKKKAKYGCTKCDRGFHVECFIAFHHRAVLKNSPQLRASLEAVC